MESAHVIADSVQVLGLWLLWLSWYSFNMGSTLAITGGWSILAGYIGVSMTICACVWMYERHHRRNHSNGVIAGLVAITPACGFCLIWAAFPMRVGTFSSKP